VTTNSAYTKKDPAVVAAVNPFRYRSYFYDSETQLYYLQSRYYNPVWGRFVNADGRINTSLGILGINVFAYCLNNPVNAKDFTGRKPGDLFETIEDAVYDFATIYNPKSIEENKEYATYIYIAYERVEITDYARNHDTGEMIVTTVVVMKVRYTYVTPWRGNHDTSLTPFNWLWINQVVALAHTHAAYDPGYKNDVFSDKTNIFGIRTGDKAHADRRGLPSYVVTPLGIIRRYDPKDGSDIVLFTDLPYDPNHPSRKGK
jgi:RHS repeat-associated protein